MSLLSEMTRPYWLAGLHAVTDVRTSNIRNWIVAGNYQIYSPLEAETAVLSFQDADSIAIAFAGDITRMSVAAFESVEGITPSSRLPKSTAWLLVRAYYAAFFAAHCVLRVFGRSCTQLDANAVNSIHEIADLFDQRGQIALTKGIYRGHVITDGGAFKLSRLSALGGGSHTLLWAEFSALLSYLSERVLLDTATRPGQAVSAKLIEIQTALLGFSHTTGWLSIIRNRVNYQLEYGTWFPYRERAAYYDSLFDILARWKVDPMQLNFWSERGRELQRFMEANVIVLSLCRAIIEDMSSRAPSGRSFHRFGFNALIDLLSQPRQVVA
jgi:hypothetical protein